MTGDIVCFAKRRSYLEECRIRGIHQAEEEALAELASILKSSLGAEILYVQNEMTVEAMRSRDRERVRQICEIYQLAGLGDAHFPLLEHFLLHDAHRPEDVRRAFEIVTTNIHRPKGD